jgi:hypothetical protein
MRSTFAESGKEGTIVNEDKTWDEVRAEYSLSDQRMAIYQRLAEAEHALAPIRRRRPVGTVEPIADVIDAVLADGDEGDLYLSVLSRYVAALGGRLEVHAVFDDETVTLPGGAADAGTTR